MIDEIAADDGIRPKTLLVRDPHTMRYGHISGVDKPVSRLVMGTMVVHTERLPFSYGLLDHFYEIGGTALDTAHVYGGGHSEKAVGAWVRSRGVRDNVVVIAKGAATADVTPELLTREMLVSLDRLDIGAADLYLMHRDNINVPVSEFVDCLELHRQSGRIRAYGGSNWSSARLEAANAYAAKIGASGFVASSPNFSLAMWNEPMWSDCISASHRSEREWYEKSRMPLLAWSSQASGFFTGRYRKDEPVTPCIAEVVRVWFNDKNFERLSRAQTIANKYGVTALQVALAYVLLQDMEIFALIGPHTLDETKTSAQALDVTLSPEDVTWLRAED